MAYKQDAPREESLERGGGRSRSGGGGSNSGSGGRGASFGLGLGFDVERMNTAGHEIAEAPVDELVPLEARQSHEGITNYLQLEVSLSTGSVVAALLQAHVPSMVGGVIYEAQVLHISTEGAGHTSANLSRDGAFVEGRHF